MVNTNTLGRSFFARYFHFSALLLMTTVFTQVAHAQSPIPHVLDSILDKRLLDQRNALGVRGLSAAIQFPDGSVWEGVAGISSAAPVDSITPQHLFNIGSVTKTITSACILQMVDENLLSLDDSLHEWLPTYEYIDSNITIRQLMRHQSGIYDILMNPAFQPTMFNDIDSMWTPHNAIKTFIQAPEFAPGTSWAYSNTNYMLLGMIIETVSGKPYYQVVRERFLDPLDLASFVLPPHEPVLPPASDVWVDITGDGVTDNAGDLIYNWNSFNYVAGAAGLYFSTAGDLARWIRAVLSAGIISDSTLNEAKETVASQPAGVRYGLGIMERKFLNNLAYGHGGDLGYCANAWYFPEKDVSITVLNNDAKKNSWQIAPVVQVLLKACIDYQMATPAEDLPLANQAQVTTYPNPFTREIYLSAILPEQFERITCEMVNYLGETVLFMASVPTDGFAINTALPTAENLPGGLYFLQLYGDGQLISTKKVIKQ